jgi:glycosyltransferase involved in cell wall biosynthesis
MMGVCQRVILAALLAVSWRVATSSHALVDEIMPWHWSKRRTIEQIPIGITARPLPGAHLYRAAARVELGFGDDDYVLAFFGNLHESKRVEWLFQALAATAEVGGKLLLIGSGSDEIARRLPGDLDSLRDKVSQLGYCSDTDLQRYLVASDLVLLPFVDGVSVRRSSLALACSLGLPIASTVSGLSDRLLVDAGCFGLAPADDGEAYAAMVRQLWLDIPERERLGREARRLFERELTWPSIAGRYRRLWESKKDFVPAPACVEAARGRVAEKATRP